MTITQMLIEHEQLVHEIMNLNSLERTMFGLMAVLHCELLRLFWLIDWDGHLYHLMNNINDNVYKRANVYNWRQWVANKKCNDSNEWKKNQTPSSKVQPRRYSREYIDFYHNIDWSFSMFYQYIPSVYWLYTPCIWYFMVYPPSDGFLHTPPDIHDIPCYHSYVTSYYSIDVLSPIPVPFHLSHHPIAIDILTVFRHVWVFSSYTKLVLSGVYFLPVCLSTFYHWFVSHSV